MGVILRVIDGPHEGREYPFDRHDTFVVGRSPQVQFPVPEDPFLSRDHFLIEFNPPACFLKDMGSTNGTKVNGVRVNAILLHHGDVISAGKSSFQIRVEDSLDPGVAIRCLACQCPAPRDVVVAARPGDGEISWLCAACSAQRRRYPTPPEGYWIEARLGGGGMGEVYRARELKTRRIVAIKMMIPTAAASQRAREYFRREVEVLKNLRHPHIVEFFDMIEDLGQFHLVMEYVEGPNAREWASRQPGPPAVAAVARIGTQLLSALQHAHAKGFVHRDIKPSNLIVTGPADRPDIKLTDFGLAKSFRDDSGFSGLTHQGDVCGSIGFLSPDQLRDFREVKEPADIYSAGATLFYLLTGHYPFLDFDPNRTDAYTMILEHPPVPVRVFRGDVPEGLERILRKSLEKQPRDRWRSAAAMGQALAEFAVVDPSGAGPVS